MQCIEFAQLLADAAANAQGLVYLGLAIYNADGSFGGSLDSANYGPGAPKDGQYDVVDSPYYVVNNDYYNMPSTEQRIIFPQFSTYQQTMKDTSGLACLMMVLNYAGQNVTEKYTEQELLKKYEHKDVFIFKSRAEKDAFLSKLRIIHPLR